MIGPSGSFFSRFGGLGSAPGGPPMQNSFNKTRMMQPNMQGSVGIGMGMPTHSFHPQGDLTAGMPAGNVYGGMTPANGGLWNTYGRLAGMGQGAPDVGTAFNAPQSNLSSKFGSVYY